MYQNGTNVLTGTYELSSSSTLQKRLANNALQNYTTNDDVATLLNSWNNTFPITTFSDGTNAVPSANTSVGDRIRFKAGAISIYPSAIGLNTNTMWYSVNGTDSHLFYVGGNEMLKITKSSTSTVPLIGINQTTPAYTLDITGDINFTGNLYKGSTIFTTPVSVPLDLNSSTQAIPRLKLTGIDFYLGTTSTDGIAMLLGVNGVNNRQLWIGDTANLAVNTTNPVVRILVQASSGNIDCVATNGATALPLTIGNSGNTLSLNGSGIYFNCATLFANTTWHLSADGKFRFYFDTNSRTYYGGTGYTFRNSGNLDIFALEDNGKCYFYNNIWHSSSDGRDRLYFSSTGETYINSTNTLIFCISGTTRAYIDSGGTFNMATGCAISTPYLYVNSYRAVGSATTASAGTQTGGNVSTYPKGYLFWGGGNNSTVVAYSAPAGTVCGIIVNLLVSLEDSAIKEMLELNKT